MLANGRDCFMGKNHCFSPLLFLTIYPNRWVSPLLMQRRKEGTLQLTDLYNLPPHLESTTLTDKLETNWFDEIKRNPEKPSLFRATLRTMRWKLLLLGLLLVVKVSLTLRFVISFIMYIYQELLNIAQPLFLILLMEFFEPCSTMPAWRAWLLVVSTVLVAFVSSIIFNQVSIMFFAGCNSLSLDLLSNFNLGPTNASCLHWSCFSKSKYYGI
jgi:hypothetical protein